MFFKLADNIALRSWNDVKYAYYIKGEEFAQPLTQKQAEVLLLCDGEHYIEIDDTVMQLSIKRLILSCQKGESRNIETMLPTAKVLNDMGVSEMRIIRTTEVPRWTQNAGDACLTIEEYYEKMLDFAKTYQKSGMNMFITVWQFLALNPREKAFSIVPVQCSKGEYKPTFSGCRGNRGMIAVTSSGEVVPCMQESGYLMQMGKHFGNVHTDRLKDILTESPYLENICTTVGTIREENQKCGSCKWFENCTGGCRALGLLFSGKAFDFNGSDITKCFWHILYKRLYKIAKTAAVNRSC